ncbi:hypothetical protein NC653_007799 [Populus alba x Populus x berolinensis]|uniref:Uncharacterized protein n=1 Tax=Populus alba x Populus x berolinensis TaxID=444605 RepID=A0AAD6W896_9ROSI|nr:hypothetical protein NC653_007799 [Populus alba x Populus x berolinensis]
MDKIFLRIQARSHSSPWKGLLPDDGVLGLIKIHSPMRADPSRIVHLVPSQRTITAARIASEKLLRRVGAGSGDPLRACSIRKKLAKRKSTSVSGLRKAAVDHQNFVKGTTMYPLEHHPGHGLLCTLPKD